MGYYTGNGVVRGGGETINQFGALVYNGAHFVLQKVVSSTTVKSGVELTDCTGEHASMTTQEKTFSWANAYPWMGCVGSKKDVSYARISDSNLFELTITNSTMTASGDGGSNWVTYTSS